MSSTMKIGIVGFGAASGTVALRALARGRTRGDDHL